MTEDERKTLLSASRETLEKEIALLHGILWETDGYKLRGGGFLADDPLDPLFVREWSPGVFIKLRPPTVNDGPGWSWYISDKPDATYWERGGGCFFDDARRNAEEEVVDVLRNRETERLYREQNKPTKEGT